MSDVAAAPVKFGHYSGEHLWQNFFRDGVRVDMVLGSIPGWVAVVIFLLSSRPSLSSFYFQNIYSALTQSVLSQNIFATTPTCSGLRGFHWVGRPGTSVDSV